MTDKRRTNGSKNIFKVPKWSTGTKTVPYYELRLKDLERWGQVPPLAIDFVVKLHQFFYVILSIQILAKGQEGLNRCSMTFLKVLSLRVQPLLFANRFQGRPQWRRAMIGGLIRGLNDTFFRIFVRNASLAISGAGYICDKPPRKLFWHAFLNIVVNLRFQISRWSRLPTLHYTRHNSSGQCRNFLLSVGPKIVVSTGL